MGAARIAASGRQIGKDAAIGARTDHCALGDPCYCAAQQITDNSANKALWRNLPGLLHLWADPQ